MFAVLHIADFALHAALRTKAMPAISGAKGLPQGGEAGAPIPANATRTQPQSRAADFSVAAAAAATSPREENLELAVAEDAVSAEALVLPFEPGIPGVTLERGGAAVGRTENRGSSLRTDAAPSVAKAKTKTKTTTQAKALPRYEATPRSFAGRAARRDSKRPASDYCPPGQAVAEQLRELNRAHPAVPTAPGKPAAELVRASNEERSGDEDRPSPLSAFVASPLALLSGDPKRATVVACSLAARAAGVELGMSAPQALARCVELTLVSPDSVAEAEAQAVLLAMAWQLSPNVESTAPGVVTIDLTALDSDRRERGLLMAVEQLAALALPATAGLARTPLLAFYAARHVADLRMRVASPSTPASAAYSSITAVAAVLNVGNGSEFLAPLPLNVASPSEEHAAVLGAWGVHTLGQLVALPKRAIARRLGAEGVALWERAAGETTRPLKHATPPAEFTAAMDFENEIETLEPLLFILRRFVDRLALELLAAGFVAAEMAIALKLADDSQYARSFRLPEPTSAAEILFRVLHTHLESVQTAAAIAGVSLRLEPVRPLVRQRGLFESELRDPHGFAETLARVVAIVGSGRVGTPQVLDTHRPDAFTLVPPTSVVPPGAPAPVHPTLGVPLRRFRPPLVATVELDGRAPAFVWCSAMHGPVAAVHGPWRGAGDWWEMGRSWEREEWDVEMAAGGGSYRVVHTPAGWFVEGEYD